MENKKTILQYARDNAFETLKEETKEMEDLSFIRDAHGEGLLHWAAKNNNIEMMAYLMDDKKCYINLCNYYGASALHYAAISKSKEATEFLIGRYVNPRLISAFSGRKAHESSGSEEITDILTKYLLEFEEKILNNPFSNYKYRYADHWSTSMHALSHPNTDFYIDYPISPMAKMWYKKEGLSKLIEICKEQDLKYQKYLYENVKDSNKYCLICGCRAFQPCRYCKKVSICLGCLDAKYNDPLGLRRLIAQNVDIHLNNCMSGIFE